MRVLIIGSGGREHALAHKIAQSKNLSKLFIAPGNGGTENIAQNIALNIDNHQEIIEFCAGEKIDLIIIGPEAPLVNGLADDLRNKNFIVFGPSKQAAMLEGSKYFTKKLCDEMNIPTAKYKQFSNEKEALNYLEKQKLPIVIKADGLAAGKGVVVATNMEQAKEAIKNCFAGAFGAAGQSLIIEEYLSGEEVSIFALSDGENYQILAGAQDHKRAFDNDEGPNTGGMGAYSPAPIIDDKMLQKIDERIIAPTILGMKQRCTPFCGVLFAGLMIADNEPKLIEHNVRFGDPECQALMLRLKSDLLDLLYDCARGVLGKDRKIDWRDEAALCVVMAAKGYPAKYKRGTIIRNIEQAESEFVTIFHAGTKRENNQILANGGRVLNIVAIGENVKQAKMRAYQAISKIDWQDGFYRTDIGNRAIKNP